MKNIDQIVNDALMGDPLGLAEAALLAISREKLSIENDRLRADSLEAALRVFGDRMARNAKAIAAFLEQTRPGASDPGQDK